jgi:hypothetical protein
MGVGTIRPGEGTLRVTWKREKVLFYDLSTGIGR